MRFFIKNGIEYRYTVGLLMTYSRLKVIKGFDFGHQFKTPYIDFSGQTDVSVYI